MGDPASNLFKPAPAGRQLHCRHAQVFGQLDFELIAGSDFNLLAFLGAEDNHTDCDTNGDTDCRTFGLADMLT